MTLSIFEKILKNIKFDENQIKFVQKNNRLSINKNKKHQRYKNRKRKKLKSNIKDKNRK